MNDQNNNFGDLINIIALAIGLENLFENRIQTAQNDVNAANDAQAEYLLNEINRRFDEQNEKIERLLETIENLQERKR